MRVQLDRSPWDADDDVETRVFFEPAPETPSAEHATESYPRMSAEHATELYAPKSAEHATELYPRMSVSAVEVTDRFQVPAIAHVPALVQMPRVETTYVRRSPRPPTRGIVFAVACVLVGTLIGGAIAVGGSSRWKADAANTAAAAAPPAAAPAPATAAPPVIAAAAVAPPAPAPAPAPIVTPIEAPPPAPINLPAPAPTITDAAPIITDDTDDSDSDPDPVPTKPPSHARARHHGGATGTLDVSTKPPCEIVIDGKATGMVTPRRSIELAAGRHAITLTNAEQGVHLTAQVVVTANHATQLIEDFTN